MSASATLRRTLSLVAVALATGLAPPVARAQEPPRPAPPPVPPRSPSRILPPDVPYPPLISTPGLRRPLVWEGKRFSAMDWVITGAAAAVTIGSGIIKPRQTHWQGGRLWDESARDTLRLGSPAARFSARDVSDVILSLEATWPFFVDSLIVAWFFHGSPDAAAEIALIDAKALAIVTAVHGATTILASRERPYGRDCGSDFLPDESGDCEGSRRYRSFFSGHASTAFMGASLICVHHLKLELFGNPTADALSCVVAYGGAVTTALMRTLADVHYTTDVIVGAAVGTVLGIGIPLLHYRKRGPREQASGVEMTLMPFGAGLALGGIF